MNTKSKEIVLIAPYADLCDKSRDIIQKMSLENVDVVLANLDEGLVKAREKLKGGAKVFISRGGTFTLLRDVLRVPLVEIGISAYDLVASYPQLLKLDEPIAIVGYRNIISGFDLILDVAKNVTKIEITHESNVEALILSCVESGIRVFAGDFIVGEVCKKFGLRFYLWVSSETSILAAIDTAEQILVSSKREIELVRQYLALIDYVHDGVISIDENYQIKIMNAPAQEILDIQREHLVGKNIGDLPMLKSLSQEISKGRQIIEEIHTLNNARVTLNVIPIIVNQERRGCVMVFQEIANLQNLEQKVRMQLVHKGFIAKHSFSAILHKSQKIEDCISIAEKFSQYDSPILIEGDTGVGKELFAQSIHNAGKRKSGPFVAINCAALAPSIVESELFGYEEGAFTGSRRGGKAGVFEMAHRGTLFLDEISELPLDIQGRLLRVIQEKEVVRLGGDRVIPLDFKLISATNQNLVDCIEEGKFRRDLYFRINTCKFYIPSLNDRPEDILVIAYSFLSQFANKYAKVIKGYSKDAEEVLMNYTYIGNVRELRGMVERAVIICERNFISAADVRFGLANEDIEEALSSEREMDDILDEQHTLQEIEDVYIQKIWNKTGHSMIDACRILGISRTTLWRKLHT